MAVDFIHRLLVCGPVREVEGFRGAVGRTVNRKLLGKPGWRERVPLSFAAIYELCPELSRRDPEPPYDPYDLSSWPKVLLPQGREEVRYKFHTRNLEMPAYLLPLSKRFPRLEFTLLTFCLDDDSMINYLIRAGRKRQYTLPQARHAWHWEQARKKFGLSEDALYGDDDARFFAEEGMLEEALNHWDQLRDGAKSGARGMPQRRRRRNWWNGRMTRELDFEREVYALELSKRLQDEEAADRPAKKKARKR